MYNKFWFSGAAREQLTFDFREARLQRAGSNLEKEAKYRQVRLVGFFQGDVIEMEVYAWGGVEGKVLKGLGSSYIV